MIKAALWWEYLCQSVTSLVVQRAQCLCFDFAQPANSLSMPSSSHTAVSWLRQLEAITLNQQTPGHLHHTKKPCAHSAYNLCQRAPWVCTSVWVHSKCLSMAIFLSLSQTSLHLLFCYFLLFLILVLLIEAQIRSNMKKNLCQAAACGSDLADCQVCYQVPVAFFILH